MSAPALAFIGDEAPASAALFAALVGVLVDPRGPRSAAELELGLAVSPSPGSARVLAQVARTCARRGLAVELGREAIVVAGRSIPVLARDSEGELPASRARLRGQRVELTGGGSPRLGERAELLAAAPLLDAIERGPGLRWAIVAAIEGRDSWRSPVDLHEQRPDPSLDAALQRCFPALVGRVGFTHALGPQLGAALHLSALLGAGASVDGLRDRLAAPQPEQPGSPWPPLRSRPGWSSADTLGEAAVLVDPDALTSAGPLVRITAYYDPATILAGDLLRRALPSASSAATTARP